MLGSNVRLVAMVIHHKLVLDIVPSSPPDNGGRRVA